MLIRTSITSCQWQEKESYRQGEFFGLNWQSVPYTMNPAQVGDTPGSHSRSRPRQIQGGPIGSTGSEHSSWDVWRVPGMIGTR
jgi:hypothetical protein